MGSATGSRRNLDTVSQQPAPSCPNCGAAAPPGATFCPTCGNALAAAPPGAAPPGAAPPGAAPPGGAPPWRASLSPQDRRLWAMGAHGSAAIGALVGGLGSFVGPLVIWLIRREDTDSYVTGHALEALNFNITVDLILVAGFLLGFLTLGIGFFIILPLFLVVGVLWLVFTIQAAMAASRGEMYRYPMSIRLVS